MPISGGGGAASTADPLDAFDTAAMALSGCQSYYKFRDPAPGAASAAYVRDSKGSIHGTLVAGNAAPSAVVPLIGINRGLRQGGCGFPGSVSGGYVSLLDNYDFAATAAFSLLMLIRPSGGLLGTTRYLAGKVGGSAAADAYDCYIASTEKIGFRRYDAAAAVDTITGGTSVVPNTEYLVILSYDGTNLRIFLDGVSDATAVASSKSVQNVTTAMTIGRLVSSAGGICGEIGRFGIYNVGLTLANAAALQALRA